MPFWFKKKETKQDIDAVKQAVSGEVPSPQLEEKDLLKQKIILEKPPERPRFAPLFVKIDRYREVLSTIENLKTLLLSVRDLLNLTQQIDKIKNESQLLMQKNIQEIARYVAALDTEFIRPKGIDIASVTAAKVPLEVEKVEDYVSDLQHELENLRSRLQVIE